MTRAAGEELIVLTQNVWGAAAQWAWRRDLLVEKLRELRPHVIGLQEVYAADARDLGRTQAHEIAERVEGYETFFAPGKVCNTRGFCEGIALLCRCDVREHAIEALTLDPEDRWDGASQRVVLCGMLDLAEGPVDVFVTHMSLSARARQRTICELAAFASRERQKSGSFAAILMGDLNATPDETSISMLESDDACGGAWIDVWKRLHGSEARGGTWPALLSFRRIDYVFAQPDHAWRLVACDRLPFAGSDHRGVLARLVLGPRMSTDVRSEARKLPETEEPGSITP